METVLITVVGFIVSVLHPSGTMIETQNTLIAKSHIETVKLEDDMLTINMDGHSPDKYGSYRFIYDSPEDARKVYIRIKRFSNWLRVL